MNPRDRLRVLGLGLAGLGAAPALGAEPGLGPVKSTQLSSEPWKIVMQISDSLEQAYEGLVNIQNVLQIDPKLKFTVVGYSRAIRFLLNGTKTPSGALFSGMIGDLANQGVVFKACQNTLTFMKIPASDVVLEATMVAAGVYEVVRLQAQGWYYIKP